MKNHSVKKRKKNHRMSARCIELFGFLLLRHSDVQRRNLLEDERFQSSLWPHAERVKTVCLKPEKRSALLNTVKRPVKIVLSEQFSSNNIHVQKATQ